MPRIRVPISNFQFGEISPSLVSRTDTNVYMNSGSAVENFFLKNEGGLLKRFGIKKIYEFDTTPDLDNKVQQHRLVPFIFSDDERYIISLENQKIRCFQISPTTGAISLVATVTQDSDGNALPFTDSILHQLTYAQSGDTMFICHNTFATRQLNRTSLTDFNVSSFLFEENTDGTRIFQPYHSFQGAGVTLDPSGTSGSVTLTTSSAYWDTSGTASGGNYPDSKHVGVTVRYADKEITITSVQSTTQATGTVITGTVLSVDLDTDAFRSVDGTADLEVTHIFHGLKKNDSITISKAGGIAGITASNINGTRTVQEVIDENHYVITAGANANASVDGGGAPRITTHAPTTNWDEQSFSSYRGYPAAVTFHENRLWFGGTIGQPDGIWASRSNEYFNFNTADGEDSDALNLTASIGEINSIRHIVSNRDLQIFTSTSEFYIPAFSSEPITPTNAQIKRQTPFGASYVRPQSYDGATVYIQKTGSVCREYLFSDAEAAYVSSSVSSLSPHLISDPIQMTVLNGALSRPESYLFVVNLDGSMALFTSNRAEKRAGWTKITTNGLFHSIITIDDRVFMTVVYNTGAGQKFILCEFSSTVNLDFSNTFTGTAGVFSVSGHFVNGAVVDVVSGTDYLGQFTVASNQVDVSAVDNTLTSVEIGFKFNLEATTMPLDGIIQGGPLTGQPRSVSKVIVDVRNTQSVSVNGTDLILRQVTDDLSLGRQSVTGKKEFRFLGYSKDPAITISQSSPLPLDINGLVAEVSF
tara:strand:- start:1287 stop:3557 length:2271 start_codon:yes stop_codon:yes gene_type:complete